MHSLEMTAEYNMHHAFFKRVLFMGIIFLHSFPLSLLLYNTAQMFISDISLSVFVYVFWDG